MIVIGFPEGIAQARALAEALGCDHAAIDVHRFPDGESRLQLPPALPPEVILFRTLDDPNAKLVELIIAGRAARELGATHLTLVAPYLCYMRQDKAFEPGQAVSQRIIGRLLAEHFDHVVTVDPHLHRVARLEEAVPAARATTLSAAALLGAFLKQNVPSDALLLGPDEESDQWVTKVAWPGGFGFAVARKERLGDRQVQVTLPPVPVQDRVVVLVDDVIASGHTMVEAARELRAAGATAVHAIATHGLFAGDAKARMQAAGIDRIWTSDSIPQETAAVHLGPLLAGAISGPPVSPKAAEPDEVPSPTRPETPPPATPVQAASRSIEPWPDTIRADDGHGIPLYTWSPEGTPRAQVLIAHGMAEHGGRYEPFARHLAARGMRVHAIDHRGHGRATKAGGVTGHFADRNGWMRVISDLDTAIRFVWRRDSSLPIFLLGHSMGSFISQGWAIRHGGAIDGLILSGSNAGPAAEYAAGRLVARMEALRQGKRGKSALLEFLSFGSFNRRFRPARTPYDWLSRDTAEVDKYIADPLCGFRVSNQLWIDLLGGLIEISSPANLVCLPPELPVLLVGGDKDPVGRFGKGVPALATRLREAGMRDVKVRLYPDGRHEMLNETNRPEVFADITAWIDAQLANPEPVSGDSKPPAGKQPPVSD